MKNIYLAINSQSKEAYYVPLDISKGVSIPKIPNHILLGPYKSKSEAKKHLPKDVKLRN